MCKATAAESAGARIAELEDEVTVLREQILLKDTACEEIRETEREELKDQLSSKTADAECGISLNEHYPPDLLNLTNAEFVGQIEQICFCFLVF